MTLEKALKTLIEEHQKAIGQEWIHDPVAYALYQTWKQADDERKKKDAKTD